MEIIKPTPHTRLKEIRESLNLNQKAFSKRIGITQSYLSAVEGGRKEVTVKLAKVLFELFGVSLDWIFLGIDEKSTSIKKDTTAEIQLNDTPANGYYKILKRYELGNEEIPVNSSNVQSDESSKQKMPSQLTMPHYPKNNLQILPIVVTPQNIERIVAVPFFAEAGYTRGFQDTSFIQDLPHFSLPQLGEGTYRAFQIRGDSMESSLNSGDWVVGRYVDRVQGLQAGTICVVLLKDEGILCKRVEKRGKMGVMLHSNNPRYSPIEPESENILEMWEVRAVLRYLF